MEKVSLTKISNDYIDAQDAKYKKIIEKVNQISPSDFKSFIYSNYLIPSAKVGYKSCSLVLYKQYVPYPDLKAVYLPDFSKVLDDPYAYNYFINHKAIEYFKYIAQDPDITSIKFTDIKHDYFAENCGATFSYEQQPAIQIDIKWK